MTIITADEVAALLGLDRKTVYAGAAAGEIPCRRVRQRWIFCRETVEAWLRGTVVSTASDVSYITTQKVDKIRHTP